MIRSDHVFVSVIMLALSTTIISLPRKRAPPDEYGLGNMTTSYSAKFKKWNESLKKAKIIPDVFTEEVPQPLTVVYLDDNINFGTLLEYHRVDVQPIDLDWLGREGDRYTAIMTNPDFPDAKNPYQKEYLHWMVTNMKDPFVKGGETIAQYIPPSNKHAPTLNVTCKGIHRIVFVVYKHLKGKVNVAPEEYTPLDDLEHIEFRPHNRENFSSKAFAKEHHLVPFAANYFRINMDIVEEDYEYD